MIGTACRLVGHFYIHNGDDQHSFANAAEFFNNLLGLDMIVCRRTRRFRPAQRCYRAVLRSYALSEISFGFHSDKRKSFRVVKYYRRRMGWFATA